jgi:hypothetical protein
VTSVDSSPFSIIRSYFSAFFMPRRGYALESGLFASLQNAASLLTFEEFPTPQKKNLIFLANELIKNPFQKILKTMAETKPKPTARRGLVEDIVLYVIVAIVIAITSWFIITTQERIEEKLKGADNTQVFLEAFEKAGAADPSADTATRSYYAYLQAQANLNKKRYDMGSLLVVAGMTRKNMGFLVGMILALLGCVIVVRRIRQMPVEASGNVSGGKVSLITASPGVLLVLMGTAIILATVLRSEEVYVNDFEPVLPASAAEKQAPPANPANDTGLRAPGTPASDQR